jgi:hypothetical protein
MPGEPLTVDDLLIRIRNYEISRKTAPKSIRPWLDRMIEEAESQIAALRNPSEADEPAAAPAGSAESPPQLAERPQLSARYRAARQTYPFDDRIPFQRLAEASPAMPASSEAMPNNS